MNHVVDAPLEVHFRRGGHTESVHRVHAVVASPTAVEASWGDPHYMTLPRSAIKSIQVLPLLTEGAAEAFAVSDDEVALACSSHGAEAPHLDGVRAWLDRIELDESALECGPSDPITPEAAKALYAAGKSPTALHNCCSGKHTGFLTLARHRRAEPGFELPGYLDPDHGVQRLVTNAQSALTGIDLSDQKPVIDGCGIPAFRFPLLSLAQAMARLVTPSELPEDLRGPASRVVDVLPSRAFLVSGTGRAEQVLTKWASEPVILKGGAEGAFMGALPGRSTGFALKCEDGSSPGVDEALSYVLHHLGATAQRVSINSPLRNRAGTVVGNVVVIEA